MKIHKRPLICVCDVKNFKKIMTNLKLEKADRHEQWLKTLANIKILTGDEN